MATFIYLNDANNTRVNVEKPKAITSIATASSEEIDLIYTFGTGTKDTYLDLDYADDAADFGEDLRRLLNEGVRRYNSSSRKVKGYELTKESNIVELVTASTTEEILINQYLSYRKASTTTIRLVDTTSNTGTEASYYTLTFSAEADTDAAMAKLDKATGAHPVAAQD